MAVLKRFKHQTLSKRICQQLIRIPSLGLGREVRCGQKIHGRLVTSFTVQKSFVKRIRSRPSTFCYALLRRAACIGMWLSEAVVKPYVFLRGLLLLAGDIERNPGPLQDPISPSCHMCSNQLNELPHFEFDVHCLCCYFGEWMKAGPTRSDQSCPLSDEVSVSPLSPVRPAHLLLLGKSSIVFNALTRRIAALITFLLWQAALVAPAFLLLFLLEVAAANLDKAKAWRKAGSRSGNSDISYQYKKMHTFKSICVQCPLNLQMTVTTKCKNLAVSQQLCGLLAKPYVFLRELLLLAGDVEPNPGPVLAEEVLLLFRDRFIAEVDANAIVMTLLHNGIINEGDQREVSIVFNPIEKNKILHLCLRNRCTNDALKMVCDVMIGVAGNPKMAALGTDMQRRLETDLSLGFTETDCSTLYQNAIRDNPTITLHISKAVTIGPPQVGKTTVRRRLLGLPQPRVSSSTAVMERADTVSLCNVEGAGLSHMHRVAMRNEYESRTYMEQGDKWVMLNNATVIESLLHHLQKKFGVTATEVRSKKGSYSGEAPTQPSSAMPVEDSPRSVTDVSRRIYKKLQERDKAEVDLPDAYLLQFVDCGGQLAYHDILPIFVNIPAIYLHVFNVSKDLNERPKDELCSCRGEKKYSAESALTVVDMIKRSMMTVHLLADKKVHLPSEVKDDNKSPKPHIVLVGTHLDKLSETDQEINTTLEAKGETLRSALRLQSHSLEGMLMKDLDNDGMFFPVSSTPHEKCTAENLRSRIGHQAKMDAVKVKVPVRWYLHLLLEMSHGVEPMYAYCVLYQRCKGEGSITDPGDFHAMVTYFHALGLLIHLCEADVRHTEESNCLVFTNPSYLYENISKIYEVQFEKEVEGEYKLQLKCEGKLTVEVLQQLGVKLDPSQFMDLLVQLFIGAEIKPHEDKKEEREGKQDKWIEKGERMVKKTLFVPSVLVNSILDWTGDAAIPKDSVSFALTFKHTSFVPCGVFTGMIARLQSAPKWNIDTFSISRTRMKFDVRGQQGTVYVLDCATHISVEFNCRKRLRTEQYQECRDTIITATANSFCFLFHSKADKDTQRHTCHACSGELYLVLGQTCHLCPPQPGLTQAPHFARLEVDNGIPVSVRCCETRETKDLRDRELEQAVFTNITYYAVIEEQRTSHTPNGAATVAGTQCNTGVFGDGGGQENMSPPTPGAPHVRGRPPGDIGYGLPPPTWAPYPHDVRQHVGQHQVPYTVGPVYPPLGYPYPPPPQGWFPPHQGTHSHPYWTAPGPSGITAPPPPPALPIPSMVAPAPPTQPFTAASDSPAPMSHWNMEALKFMREKLGNLQMRAAGMIKKLEKSDLYSPANPTLGFLSGLQLQVVESKTTPADQMNKVIDFLLQMEDKYFDNFCKILEQSNFGLQAKMLRDTAKDLKRSCACPLTGAQRRECFIVPPHSQPSPGAVDTALPGDVPGPSRLSTPLQSSSTGKRPAGHKSAPNSPAKRRQ